MSELALTGGPAIAADLQRLTGSWPRVGDAAEEALLLSVLRSGHWGRLHDDSYAEKFERAYAAFQDAQHGIAVANGTVSLQLILRTLNIGFGDEVIVPALTFIATASAVAEVGAVPIFADVDPETLTIDPTSVEAAITPRTRAIIGVHYGGYPIDFDRLQALATKHGLALIEDAAHAQGSAWRGTRVGALGTFGSFSFQESKALSSGEGGIILTNDDALAERARLLHSIGRRTDKPGYLHYALASNYRLSELQAALLLSQFAQLPAQVSARDAAGRALDDALAETGVLLPQKRDERVTQRGYYFAVYRYQPDMLDGIPREAFLAALEAEGVNAYQAYGMPVYRYDAFTPEALETSPLRGLAHVPAYHELYLPVAERVTTQEQVTIPHQTLLAGPEAMGVIVDAVTKVADNRAELRRWWEARTPEAALT
ncbi:MAG: DegT/DnrJ/EryC1/StrS family aminotransferase [Thermomicrobiales bacterium]|nr:DegT/DnrJ/EryC1/StrS family aminotransferase [Thermomicrobiales bacterium]